MERTARCTIGADIARAIRATFPEAYDADISTRKGDRAKLGTISYATVAHGLARASVAETGRGFRRSLEELAGENHKLVELQ